MPPCCNAVSILFPFRVPVFSGQVLISLLHTCRLTGDVETARALADFHLRTFSSQRGDFTSSAGDPDPRGFQEQFLRFCAQTARHDGLAQEYLRRLVYLDAGDTDSGQLFGQYIFLVADMRSVAEARATVDALALEEDFDGWPWVSTMRRLGDVTSLRRHVSGGSRGGGSSGGNSGSSRSASGKRGGGGGDGSGTAGRAKLQSDADARRAASADETLALLQRVYEVAQASIVRTTAKTADAPMWDTLVDAYVMSLTRQVREPSPCIMRRGDDCVVLFTSMLMRHCW